MKNILKSKVFKYGCLIVLVVFVAVKLNNITSSNYKRIVKKKDKIISENNKYNAILNKKIIAIETENRQLKEDAHQHYLNREEILNKNEKQIRKIAKLTSELKSYKTKKPKDFRNLRDCKKHYAELNDKYQDALFTIDISHNQFEKTLDISNVECQKEINKYLEVISNNENIIIPELKKELISKNKKIEDLGKLIDKAKPKFIQGFLTGIAFIALIYFITNGK